MSADNQKKLDMALDDISKSERVGLKDSRRGGGRGGRRGGKSTTQKHPIDLGSKILVSNLHFGVTESDLRELFSSMGPLKKVSLSFDAQGKSKGTAEVVFVRKQDAISSVKKYNNVALDGRPMRIELTTTLPSSAESAAVGVLNRIGGPVQERRGGGGRGRGRGSARGGRGRGGSARQPRRPKTAEELDAEMNAYMNTSASNVNNSGVVATTTAAAAVTAEREEGDVAMADA